METTTHHRNSIQVAKYTMGFKSFKINGIKMREVKIYRNGTWIYGTKFKNEERALRKQWAQNFLNSMKIHDLKQIQAQLETMKGF